jgi:nitrous oxide reductase
MSKKTLRDGRRRFLKTAALAGGAAGVAAAGGAAVAATDDGPAAVATPQPEGKRGYHVTAHIEKYYRLARQ